jgi:uncharacterized integral membrane protein (TIGR00698 family)
MMPHPQSRPRIAAACATLHHLGPGLALAGAIAVSAYALEVLESRLLTHQVLEALVLALLLGALVRNTVRLPSSILAGTAFASKTLLEAAVVVLGVSLDIRHLVEPGGRLLLAILLGVGVGMVTSFGLSTLLGLASRLAYLVAVGNAICGNAAIAAVAPVMRAERHEIASAVGLTAVVGMGMVLLLPTAVPVFGLSDAQYGLLAGMAVYAVPQVMAAAYAVSPLSGDVALLVKLVRVLCLGPVVLAIGVVLRWRGHATASRPWTQLLPWFVVGFFALLTCRSLGLLPPATGLALRTVGRSLTLGAMAGVGLGVELAAVRAVGPRVGIASALSMGLLVAVSLLLIISLGLHAG